MATQHIPATQRLVDTASLAEIGAILARVERDTAALRRMWDALGVASVKVSEVPAAGSGPATNARAFVANAAPVGNGYRPVPPPPTAKAQAQADMGLRPDFAATALLVGLGCTPAFVEANLASVAPNHRNKPGVMCTTCVGMLRRKWEQAQRVTGDATANAAPVAPVAPVAAPVPVEDAAESAANTLLLAFLRSTGIPEAEVMRLASLANATPTPQAPEAPKAAPVPPPAPQTDKRPYADPQALEANLANIVTPSKAQYVRDVNAARMQGLGDPTPPADAKWAADAADVSKLLRRITAASRA